MVVVHSPTNHLGDGAALRPLPLDLLVADLLPKVPKFQYLSDSA